MSFSDEPGFNRPLDQHLEPFDQRIEQLIEQHTLPSEGSALVIDEAPGSDSAQLPLTWAQAIPLLDSIPGIARQSAELLLAEVGSDMQRFPSAAHLCKWAGVCPGNHESAGKQYSGKTPPANQWLRSILFKWQMRRCAARLPILRPSIADSRRVVGTNAPLLRLPIDC